MTTYRWNTDKAAETFDGYAQSIHPFYVALQDEILSLLSSEVGEPRCVVDLGGGSGRLLERVLEQFPKSTAVLVDQSTAFLAIAERRLAPYGDRVTLVEKRLQDDWSAGMKGAPDAIVSMSAIHHLDPEEKQALYRRCFGALAQGGVFFNGDEIRPENDAEYLAVMQWWSLQKEIEITAGRIPESFRAMSEAWHDRNVRRFGRPKKSGDDCHETADVQCEYLREAGFRDVRLAWNEKLWGILFARK